MSRRLLVLLSSALFLLTGPPCCRCQQPPQRTRQQFFRTRPQDSFVSEGGRAIISCVIGNLGGRVQWTKDGLTLGYNRELPGFPRYSVVGTDESGVFNLQILNATLEDEAEYECQVGPNGTNKAIRENSRLNVLLPPTKAELVGYSSGGQLIVQDGAEVELTCRVHQAKPKPDIIWYLGGVEIAQGRREDVDEKGGDELRTTVSSTIRFRPSIEDNMKAVTCEAQHPALLAGPLTASLNIFVQHPPGAPEIEGYTQDEPIRKGDLITLVCLSYGGNPLATLTWYRNGKRADSSYTAVRNGSRNSFEFRAEAADNGAVFSCHAKNDLIEKPLVAEIKTVVQYGPESVSISGPEEGSPGSSLTLECSTADSNPPVDVWWVVDGRAVQGNHTRTVASETGGWYTRTNISLTIGARDKVKNIQCHAVNQEIGETRVQSHTINVLYPPEPPKITGYREGDQLTGGAAHRLVCSAQGGHPLATLRWFHRDTELYSEYTAGESQATALLLLTPNRTDNGATYRCVATSRAAAAPLETSVRLAVRYAPAGVRIDLAPARLREGTEAVLTCESGEASPPADLVWLLNGAPLAGEVTSSAGSYGGRLTTSRLRVSVRAEDDGSVFTCKAANSVGEVVDAITMSIAYKPEFPLVASPIEFTEGQPYVLNISANGNPADLDYFWLNAAGEPLMQANGGGGGGVSVQGGVLTVLRATRELAGTYSVFANNSEGSATTKFQIDILYGPRITSITEYVLVEPGNSATFECLFTANPVVYDGIRWFRHRHNGGRGGGDADDDDNDYDDEEEEEELGGQQGRITADWEEVGEGGGAVRARLRMRNVTGADTGRIHCSVGNGIGEAARRTTFLLVKGPPRIVQSRENRKAAAMNGGSAHLTCLAEGAPNITFTWRRHSGELATTTGKYDISTERLDPLTWQTSFTIGDVSAADYGAYECLARNGDGLTRATVTLVEPTRPDTPASFRVLNITADSVSLGWRPGFNGGSDQIYRVEYYRKQEGSLYAQPSYYDVYPMNATSTVIMGLSPATRYAFSIQALNDLGESDFTFPTLEVSTLNGGGGGSGGGGGQQANQPLVDELTDTASQSVPLIVTISVGVCGTLLLILSVVLVSCLLHKRREKMKKRKGGGNSTGSTTTSRSLSSDSSGGGGGGGKLANGTDGGLLLFNGSQGTSCYNDTMSEETMSSISEKSGGSFISPQDGGGRLPNGGVIISEGYRPHAASTYLTDHLTTTATTPSSGIYSVEQGREIGFTSSQLPLTKYTFAEDTESQYADELRRQAYIQTLGDGYTISQLGSSVSYPNSPIQEYVAPGHDFMESELQESDSDHHHHHHHHYHHLLHNHPHHQQQQQPRESPATAAGYHTSSGGGGSGGHLIMGPSATLGRHSGRFGSRKSPFQVVIPSGNGGGGGNGHNNKLTCPPPVCSTPQGDMGGGGSILPILGALGSPNRALPEFSTFGGGGYVGKLRGDEDQPPRHHHHGGGLEPSGHLV